MIYKFILLGLILSIIFGGTVASVSNTSVTISCSGTIGGRAHSLDDWPKFHHDARNTGYSGSKAPKTNATLWTYESPYIIPGCVGPAVADGRVFVPHLRGVDALNATTGELIGTYGAMYADTVPAIAYDMVFVATSYSDQPNDFQGTIFAFNEETGNIAWRFRTKSHFFYGPSVTVADGKVFFIDNGLYAVDAYTGEIVWNVTGVWGTTPAVAEGMVFVGDPEGGTCDALNQSTGEVVWSFRGNIGNIHGVSVSVADGLVFLRSAGGQVYSLNETSGGVFWKFQNWPINEFVTTPTVAYGIVFTGCEDGKIYAVNTTTGSLIWTSYIGGNIADSPAVAEDLIFASSNGYIYALNTTNGNHVWTGWVGSLGDRHNPVVAYGKVFALASDGLYCFG